MTTFDLGAYLARLGVTGPLPPTLDTVRRLHSAHVGAIPFENVDVQAGRGVRLDLESLQAKLVARRRGGYCFEQNTLFRAVLRAIGFEVSAREARVRPGEGGGRPPRTHMVLSVAIDGADWLADVGFGADGLFEPLPMDGSAHTQIDRLVRVAGEGDRRDLQFRLDGAEWQTLYQFQHVACEDIDLDVGNWWVSTHPSSVFRQRLIAQRILPDGRHALRQLTYTLNGPGVVETRTVDRAEVPTLLRDVFGLDLDDTRFPGLDDQA